VSWKLSRTVLKPSRNGDIPAQGNNPDHGGMIMRILWQDQRYD
jgi:hypothetical protein